MFTPLRFLPIGWWIAISVVLYVLVTNLLWRLSDGPARLPGRAGTTGQSPAWTVPLAAVAGFAYNIGLPYLALLFGRLDLDLLGLTGRDWFTSGAIAAAMTGATAVMLWLFRRDLPLSALPTGGKTPPSPLVTVWRVAFRQAHWGFYRAGAVAIWGPYTGVFASIGLVLGEWLLDPSWREGWRDGQRRWSLTFDLALMLTSAVLFLYTNNLWLCTAVHMVLSRIFLWNGEG